MELLKEVEIIINDGFEADQPAEEIARHVLALIRTKDIGDIVP